MRKPTLFIVSLMVLLLLITGLNMPRAQGETPMPVATHVPLVLPTAQPVCPPNCDYLINYLKPRLYHGNIIVKLKIDVFPEKSLSASQITEQHQRIQAVQDAISKLVRSKNNPNVAVGVDLAYPGTPYMMVSPSEEAIRTLMINPSVERIYLDQAFGEGYDMGLKDVTIDLTQYKVFPAKPFESEVPPGGSKCGTYRRTCEELVDLAKKYGYAKASVRFVTQFAHLPIHPELPFHHAQAAWERQQSILKLEEYRKYLLDDAASISLNRFVEVGFSATLTVEGFQHAISDPEVDMVVPGWDEIPYYKLTPTKTPAR